MIESSNYELANRMAELARTVATPRRAEDVLSDVTSEAKNLIAGVDAAGVLLIGKGVSSTRSRAPQSCLIDSTSCR